MDKELVMYGRLFGCGDQIRAQGLLQHKNVPYRFIDISRESADGNASHSGLSVARFRVARLAKP